MKNIIKNSIVIVSILFLLTNNCYAESEQWINSTGSGSTYEEAKNNALRNALELTFGTFISSNTVIRNDIMQKDEIVGISSGNIKKYKEISKVFINGKYCVTLDVLVSPEKLASFVQSKGMVVEYQGESFASNIKLMMMAEKSEKQVIQNLSDYTKLVYPQCFDYDLKAKDPRQYMSDAWEIKLELIIKTNKNFDNLYNHIIKTLNEIRLGKEGIESRVSVGRYPYVIVFNKQTGDYYGNNPEVNNEYMFALRTNDPRIILWNLFKNDLLTSIGNIRISMEADRYSRDIDFSNFKLKRDGSRDYIAIETSGNPNSLSESELRNITNTERFTYINFVVNEDKEIFAKFSYDLLMKGEYAIDVISNIKGFKVIK
jgi:hypothetical protein